MGHIYSKDNIKITKGLPSPTFRSKSGAGFTLIETIVAIAVLVLAFGIVAGFLQLGYRTQSFAFQQSQAITETRRGIEQMTKELREATTGEDGSYILETADDYELVFYTDLDKDNEVERVQYVINPAGGVSGDETQFCTSFVKGGSCSVTFSNFLSEALDSATLRVSMEGDLNGGNETVQVSGDGVNLGTLCVGSCGQCVASYENLTSFNVTTQTADGVLEVIADASSAVDPVCDWEQENHSLKARVQLSWEVVPSLQTTSVFRKIVTNPTGWPPTYTGTQEINVISTNARNEARERPMFTYYDKNNNILLDSNARLNDTTRIHLELIVNVNPERAPDDFTVETDVQLRNLRPNL